MIITKTPNGKTYNNKLTVGKNTKDQKGECLYLYESYGETRITVLSRKEATQVLKALRK